MHTRMAIVVTYDNPHIEQVRVCVRDARWLQLYGLKDMEARNIFTEAHGFCVDDEFTNAMVGSSTFAMPRASDFYDNS